MKRFALAFVAAAALSAPALAADCAKDYKAFWDNLDRSRMAKMSPEQFADLSRRNIALAPIKMNTDGGMHPVFVEAVKKNQVGVAPQEPSLFVSTPPGTIPATVRPPRIPELADASAVTEALARTAR